MQPYGATPAALSAAAGTGRGSGRGSGRADPFAAFVLVAAGVIGIWQLLLPWRSYAAGTGGAEVFTTGWQVYRSLRAVPDPTGDVRAATYSVLGVAVAAGALAVLGLLMLMSVTHRPLGAAGLLLSLLCIAAAGWVLINAQTIFAVGLFGLFTQAQPGWYLFLGTGVIGLIGSWRALMTG